MLTIFLDLLGFGVVLPLLPDHAPSFGASAAVIGALVAGYSLMQFIFGPILGALSDRIGRRPGLLGTISINGLAFVIFGLASSLATLFAARLERFSIRWNHLLEKKPLYIKSEEHSACAHWGAKCSSHPAVFRGHVAVHTRLFCHARHRCSDLCGPI